MKKQGISRYAKYIKPYWPYFVFGPIMMLSEVAGDVVLPKFVQRLIDYGIVNKDYRFIITQAVMMLGIAIIMLIGGVVGNYFSAKASASFACDIRRDVFAKVQDFSFKNIDEFSTGSLVTRLTNDITQVQNVLRMSMIMLLRSPGLLIGALIMAISINGALATVIAVVIPILALGIYIILKTAYPRFQTMQDKLDALNSGIQENITNQRVIKSFIRTDYEEQKFVERNNDLKDNTLRAMNIVITNMPLMTLAMNVTTIAVVWFGGNFIIKGDMGAGSLTAFTTYINQILMSLMILSNIFLQASRAIASMKRINQVLDAKIDLTDDNATYPDKTVEHGNIEFKNVSFRYHLDGGENILSNVSFKINEGETIGIIGTVGCGKTSLVQLIPRLYDATEGSVLVDGVDVKDYSISNLRNGVSVVLQKNVLFSGTILENLKWGNEAATFDEIRQACKAAHADSFVNEFTDGYNTVLGQGGVNLSGGQKQRLCIARALLKSPKIIILDDSTSAVDSATDSGIRRMLRREYKDVTKLIIAQRIQSVIDADKIIVLSNGSVSAIGTHDELLETSDEYRAIYDSQAIDESVLNEWRKATTGGDL